MFITKPECFTEGTKFINIDKGDLFFGHEKEGLFQLFLKTTDIELEDGILANAARVGGEDGGLLTFIKADTLVHAVEEIVCKFDI